MELTLEQAKSLNYGAIVHQVARDPNYRDGRRKCYNWRVSGKVKTWKRNPNRVKVPIKHGLYTNGYITECTLMYFHLAADCNLQKSE